MAGGLRVPPRDPYAGRRDLNHFLALPTLEDDVRLAAAKAVCRAPAMKTEVPHRSEVSFHAEHFGFEICGGHDTSERNSIYSTPVKARVHH
jgi:hypothetical protein